MRTQRHLVAKAPAEVLELGLQTQNIWTGSENGETSRSGTTFLNISGAAGSTCSGSQRARARADAQGQ